MGNSKEYTIKDVEALAFSIIKQMPKHEKTSSETQAQLDEIKKAISRQKCLANSGEINDLKKAVFGDPKDETNPGIKVHLVKIEEKLDRITKVFEGTSFVSRIIVWVFGGIVTVLGGWLALKHFLKSLLT